MKQREVIDVKELGAIRSYFDKSEKQKTNRDVELEQMKLEKTLEDYVKSSKKAGSPSPSAKKMSSPRSQRGPSVGPGEGRGKSAKRLNF